MDNLPAAGGPQITRLVLYVKNVARAAAFYEFGHVHAPDGFEFCDAKDPAGNSISSRGMK